MKDKFKPFIAKIVKPWKGMCKINTLKQPAQSYNRKYEFNERTFSRS